MGAAPTEVDVALLGAGGAGLSVLVALDREVARRRAAGLDVRVPSVALVDPVVRSGTDRTWCFWDAPDGEVLRAVEPAVHRVWRHAEVVGPDGVRQRLDLDPLRYVMVRSADFYALAEKAAASLGAVRVVARAEDVGVRARWTFDSRPAAPRRPANTAWLQHFRGWTVSWPADGAHGGALDDAPDGAVESALDGALDGALDPDVPVLMDFRTPQPQHAVSFGYVLPLGSDGGRRTALVEYTEFSRTRLSDDAYDAALRDYLALRFGAAAATAVVEEVEDGAIPMTDAVLDARPAPTVVRIGTAGGATRPSTGYTFAAMQRQAAAVASALLDGRPPVPPPAYSARHRWMDAVLLHALDRGRTGGAALLADLFTRNRPSDVLRFLDGGTSLVEDLRLMRTTPILPMTLASAGDATARLRRRLRRGS